MVSKSTYSTNQIITIMVVIITITADVIVINDLITFKLYFMIINSKLSLIVFIYHILNFSPKHNYLIFSFPFQVHNSF
jgi:hypothetical protein